MLENATLPKKKKKIKLKELIAQKKMNHAAATQFVQLEVQHVETVEHQQTVEIAVHNVQHEAQVASLYEGELFTYHDFVAKYHSKTKKALENDTQVASLYALLEQELFANLPHAIKYLSPAAGDYLSEHLESLVALNKENLPDGLVLRQSKIGEWVLDFDPFLENEHANPFTPKVADPIQFDAPMGEEQKQVFLTQLSTLTAQKPELDVFIHQHYLHYFPSWQALFHNSAFLHSIERISHYDEHKLRCFKKFLQDTGSSRHDLNHTVIAFEHFWNEVTFLCAENNLSIAGINSNWTTPKGGNPVVYMDRLRHILGKARHLEEQFKLLNGVCLDNYGAYYASRYEGFCCVSKHMELHYDAAEQNKQPYSLHLTRYKVDLEPLKKLWEQIYRYNTYILPYVTKGRGVYLLNSEVDIPDPVSLDYLLNNQIAIPFSEDAFVPPYQIYQ